MAETAFPQVAATRRPWWAAALIGGVSAGAAIVAGLGLSSGPAKGSEPQVATAAAVKYEAERQESDRLWRVRMEQKLDEALQRIAHIEGRMDRK